MDMIFARTLCAILIFPSAAVTAEFIIPFQLFPLSNDSTVYDVREDKARGTMHGRTFVSGPSGIPYPAFHLTGSTYVDLDIREPPSFEFSIATLVYFESTDTGVLYEYTDNASRLVFTLCVDAGYLTMRSFERDGTSKGTVVYDTVPMPERSWFQITINIDKTVGKVQVLKDNLLIMDTTDFFLPFLDALTPASLRVGKSTSDATASMKGRVTCLRVYAGCEAPLKQVGLQLDCDYKAKFHFLPFSGPYGCMYPPCQNGGTCADNKTMEYNCKCLDGFTGVDCETDIDECASVPCLNGGACADVVNGYTCACPSGFTGFNCQTDIDECFSDPCLNSGECVDGIDSYSCMCLGGYAGSHCETDIDECASGPCLNGGACAEDIDAYTCTCLDGFTGGDCQTDIDDCLSTPCLNGATCEDGINRYSCICPGGFTGSHCEKDVPGYYCTGYFKRKATHARPSSFAEIASVVVSSAHRCASQCMRKTGCLSFTTKQISSNDLICMLYGDVASALVTSERTNYYIPNH